MTKEIAEKKKVNPLVYFIGIPVGIYILVLSYNAWEKDRIYRECAKDHSYLGVYDYSFSNIIYLGYNCHYIIGPKSK